MGQDFMIADTHFGTDSIRRYENRPFESVQEMDEALIQNWNRVVSEGDTVYVLGDFSSYGKEENKALLKRLNGTKILIMGNHDMGYTPAEWREMGFLECSRWPILYEGFFLLSHEPLYINGNMPYANIYGHVHNNPSYKDASSQSVCVSVERLQYCPESFETIRAKMEG